jgi:quercetin dioxygenase-like cupin family protein
MKMHEYFRNSLAEVAGCWRAQSSGNLAGSSSWRTTGLSPGAAAARYHRTEEIHVEFSRRDIAALLPLVAAGAAHAQNANAPNKPAPLGAMVYKYEELPVKTSGENRSRQVFDGLTHTGYHIDLHMTELGPGQQPHPPHQHAHEEILMLRTGQLDVTMGGQTTRVDAGSVVITGSNQLHGWRNPGPGPAEYFVMAVGRDT